MREVWLYLGVTYDCPTPHPTQHVGAWLAFTLTGGYQGAIGYL